MHDVEHLCENEGATATNEVLPAGIHAPWVATLIRDRGSSEEIQMGKEREGGCINQNLSRKARQVSCVRKRNTSQEGTEKHGVNRSSTPGH